jgi:hypothetical protein
MSRVIAGIAACLMTTRRYPMKELWGWSVYAWIGLPTVMYGGYALLGILTGHDSPTDFQRTWFRAGHAHAGVLLVVFLLFVNYLERTTLSMGLKHGACAVFVAGTLALSGGFFVHMMKGSVGSASIGTHISSLGAVVLTIAIMILVYGIFFAR